MTTRNAAAAWYVCIDGIACCYRNWHTHQQLGSRTWPMHSFTRIFMHRCALYWSLCSCFTLLSNHVGSSVPVHPRLRDTRPTSDDQLLTRSLRARWVRFARPHSRNGFPTHRIWQAARPASRSAGAAWRPQWTRTPRQCRHGEARQGTGAARARTGAAEPRCKGESTLNYIDASVHANNVKKDSTCRALSRIHGRT